MTGLNIDHFVARLLQDALAEATASYWRKRAEDFERAGSRPGDYTGEASADEIARRDEWLTSVAQACRSRAEFALVPDDAIDDSILEVLEGEAS